MANENETNIGECSNEGFEAPCEDTDDEINLDDIDLDDIDLCDDEEPLPESKAPNVDDVTWVSNEEDNPRDNIRDDTPHQATENVEAPKEGMSFNSLEDLAKHLCCYAKECGFSLRKRTTKPPTSSNQPPKHISWVCNKAGQQESRSQNKMKPRPSQRVGCGAKFNAKVNKDDGTWAYSSVTLEHTNHVLTPKDVRYMRAYRKVPNDVVRRIMINDEAGIRPSRTYLAEAVKNHGFQNLPFLERDVRNLLQKKRQEKLFGPDSVAMFNYFLRSMKESNNFFFAMDVGSDGRLRNIMWVDARSRAAFKEFRDVNGLDSTYLKNRYEMPFAPFIGINHHGQTTLLGCALLTREDIESYRWLFRTWIDCMGEAPKAIITDQSIPITKAVELEMPNTRHRWCLWHIMEKQNKKFKSFKEFHKIKSAMSNCVYDSMSVDEFEANWKSFLDLYELQNNLWLATLYKERRRWVPAFVNDCFWAGMSTTQRNESVNAFFKNYVNSKTSLKEFVLKYDLALGSKCDNERFQEYKSRNLRYKNVTKFAAERFFQPIYTHYAFNKLMDEVRGCLYVTPSVSRDEQGYSDFKVGDTREYGDLAIEKRVEYMVRLEKGTKLIYCSCKLFETLGIMCRHTLKVLYDVGIQEIPDFYIVERWRKDIDRPYLRVKVPYYNPVKSEGVKRYEQMQEQFDKLAIKAMDSCENFDIVMDGIRNMIDNIEKVNEIVHKGSASSKHANTNEETRDVFFFMDNSDGTHTSVALQNPDQVQRVGRPRISVRRKQPNVGRKQSSQRVVNMNGNKRKKRNVNADDEMTPDILVSTQSESGVDCHPSNEFSDTLNEDSSFTKMMQFFDNVGGSSNS